MRCQERNQILAKGRMDEIRAFIASHDRTDPAVMKWVNDQDQCDQETEFLGFEGEEYATPFGVALEQMGTTRKGHPRALFVQRNFLVNCPVHGKRIHVHIGHHVSAAFVPLFFVSGVGSPETIVSNHLSATQPVDSA